jgi:hypothetical protein
LKGWTSSPAFRRFVTWWFSASTIRHRRNVIARSHVSTPGQRILDEFRPGHVFWFPPGMTWMNRDKPRPFALTTPCAPGIRGTLVYGSTQQTERKAGAACIQVAARRAGINRNGLWSPTCFYPGVLIRMAHAELPAHAGSLGRSLEALRAALRSALGIGQGSCLGLAAPAHSRRGRIVELQAALARDLRTPYATLLTEHWYSRAKNYHIIVPLFPAEGRQADDRILRLSSREWLAVFPQPTGTALLPVHVVQSIWYPDDVLRETEYVLDDESLSEIDQRLCAYFSLPSGDVDGG